MSVRPPPPRLNGLDDPDQLARHLVEALRRAPLVVSRLDKEGTFTLSEGAALEHLGLRPGQAVGMNAFEMYAQFPEIVERLRAVLRGEPSAFESSMGPIHFHAVYVPTKDADGEVTGAIGLGFDISERVRAEEKLAHALAEKSVLLRELEHRTRNGLQLVSSLLNIPPHARNEDCQHFAQAVRRRVRSLATAHELVDASRDASKVDFADVLKRVVGKNLMDEPPSAGTVVRVAADAVVVDLDVATHLALIASEVVSNAFRHAFPEKPGTVEIALSQPASDRAQLSVHDDGVGLPSSIDPRNADAPGGLWLVGILVEQLAGEWTVARSGGTGIHISFAAD